VFSGRRARGQPRLLLLDLRKPSGTKIEEASSDMMEVSACTLAGMMHLVEGMHEGRAAA
jgi:hypothetical protein